MVQPARPDKVAVRKTNREKEAQGVEHSKRIKPRRWPASLGSDLHALAHRLDTRTYVRYPVHLHETVGAVARQAEEAARTMVFDATAQDPDPSRVECRTDGFALIGTNKPAVQAKGEPFSPLKSQVGMMGQAAIYLRRNTHRLPLAHTYLTEAGSVKVGERVKEKGERGLRRPV